MSSVLGGGGDESSSSASSSGNSSDWAEYAGADRSQSQANINQGIWGPQANQLGDLYSQAGTLYGNQMANMGAQQGLAQNQMNQVTAQTNPAFQQQLAGGAYQGMDLQGQLNQLMAGGADTGNTGRIYGQIMGGEGNNYADAMRDQYTQDATRAQENMLRNLDARAAARGMSGGSRHGTAIGEGMGRINDQLQDNMARVGYETFDRDLQQKLGIAQMADANQLARYQGDQSALTSMLGQQQQAMQSGLAGAGTQQGLSMGQFAPGQAGWDQAQNYSNIMGAPTMLTQAGQTADSSGYQSAINEAYNNWSANQSMESSSGGGGSLLGTLARGAAAFYTGGASEAALAAGNAAG